MATGSRKVWSGAIRCDRSIASFHSRRKYPSTRSCVCFERTGINKTHALICLRIVWSQTSPPRSALWSNQTSMSAARSASQTRCAAS